jgi:hypothetical protein
MWWKFAENLNKEPWEMTEKEFNNENSLYHGTSQKAADNIAKKGFELSSKHKGYANTLEKYISLTNNINVAQEFANVSGMNVDNIRGGKILRIDKRSLKIADASEYPWQSNKEGFEEYLIRLANLGFDAVDLSKDDEFGTGEDEIALINYKKTKLLTDITWQKEITKAILSGKKVPNNILDEFIARGGKIPSKRRVK